MNWLLLLTYLFHHYLTYTVCATLQVTPLNGGCTVDTSTPPDIVITGYVHKECSFNVSTSNKGQVVLLGVDGGIYKNDSLYLDTYDTIFVAGPDPQTACNVKIPQNFMLHFRGNITLRLQQIWASSTQLVLPGKANDTIQCMDQQWCCAFQEFSYIVKCETETADNGMNNVVNIVKCDLPYSSDCTSQLHGREVVSECWSGESHQSIKQKGFIIYPANITDVNTCRYLDMQHTNLTYLSRGAFQTIQNHLRCSYIELNHNQLTDIAVGTFLGTNGTVGLHLDNNELSNLQNGSLQGLEALFFLTLESNKLTNIETGVFQNCSQIKYINLKDNYLTTIGVGVFRGLHALVKLSIASNSLRDLHPDLFIDLYSMEYLNMSRNRLDTFPNIGHMKKLNRLELWGNTLFMIDADVFDGLPNNLYAFVGQHEVCQCYLNINDTNCHIVNIVKQSNYLTCDRLLADIALACFTWVIGFCALFGNMTVLIWRQFRKEQENRIQSILLRNLAMADFLMGLYMIIIASADVNFGEHFPMQSEVWRSGAICKIAGVFATTSSEASVFFITLISIDRFLCIKYPSPSTNFHTGKTWLVVCATWSFALLLGIVSSVLSGNNPYFYDHSHLCIGLPLSLKSVTTQESTNDTTDLTWKQADQDRFKFEVTTKRAEEFEPAMYFSITVFLILNSICLILIVICYLVIIRIVQQSQKRIKKDMSRQVRLTIKVAIIVATDFCSWLPIILIGILVQSKAIPSESIPPMAYAWIVTFVLPINSAINPFLYTLATAISTNRASRHSSDKHEIQALTNKSEHVTKATSNTIL